MDEILQNNIISNLEIIIPESVIYNKNDIFINNKKVEILNLVDIMNEYHSIINNIISSTNSKLVLLLDNNIDKWIKIKTLSDIYDNYIVLLRFRKINNIFIMINIEIDNTLEISLKECMILSISIIYVDIEIK